MKTFKHTADTYYFVFDLKTKTVLVSPRPCVEGVTATYDDKRVGLISAPTLAELNTIITNKTY